MTANQRVRTIDLACGQRLVVDGARAVRVLRGAAWLTTEGQADDLLAKAGAAVALAGGRTLVEALAPARVQVEQPAASWAGAWATGWARARQRLHLQRCRWQFGPTAAGTCA